MADDKQTVKPEDQTKDKKGDELNADDLDKVSGGVHSNTNATGRQPTLSGTKPTGSF